MYQRILVPIDGGPTSELGLREAIALARLTGGRLRLMHVFDQLSTARARSAYEGYNPDWLDTARRESAKLLEDAAALAQAEHVEADTLLHDSLSPQLSDAVLNEAERWNAELIVLGTHGRRGIGRLLMGSGAESILKAARVPVLLVRAPDAAKLREAEAAGQASVATGALAHE